ncbi:MAG: WecB/TagA/CpsF family glycosyltransferase [Clostridia bacterium]
MKKDILGLNIDDVTMEEALQIALSFTESDSAKTVYTPNAEIAMAALRDSEFLEILNRGDLVIPDGAGVVLASKIINNPLKQKVAGFDLASAMLKNPEFYDKTFFFFGAKPGVAEKAVEKTKAVNPHLKVAGVQHGYFKEEETQEIIDRINLLKPDVLFVGLGAPRQEKWIHAHKDRLKVKLIMGVGGTIDGLAGEVKRAPAFFIDHHLEWLYRLIKQPKRFIRMLNIPAFLWEAVKYRGKTR